MTNQHPITPPPELVQQWEDKYHGHMPEWVLRHVAAEAARWGAEQELHACCAWLDTKVDTWHLITPLLYARRPKAPTLKEQALTALHAITTGANDTREQHQDLDTIRKALEALPND